LTSGVYVRDSRLAVTFSNLECLAKVTSVHTGLELETGVEFTAPPDTILVMSEAVITANHLTDTDKQNSTGEYSNNAVRTANKNKAMPWFSRLLRHLARKRHGLIV